MSLIIPKKTMWDMEKVEFGYFRLNPEQRYFKMMLARYPRLAAYWDFDDLSCDLAGVDRDIGSLSHGEQIMLRFFVAVWCGENGQFDLIDAARSLDDPHRQVIIDWLTDPVLP